MDADPMFVDGTLLLLSPPARARRDGRIHTLKVHLLNAFELRDNFLGILLLEARKERRIRHAQNEEKPKQ